MNISIKTLLYSFVLVAAVVTIVHSEHAIYPSYGLPECTIKYDINIYTLKYIFGNMFVLALLEFWQGITWLRKLVQHLALDFLVVPDTATVIGMFSLRYWKVETMVDSMMALNCCPSSDLSAFLYNFLMWSRYLY